MSRPHFHYGDADKVAAAFAGAAHVTRLEIPSNRIVVCSMEPTPRFDQENNASLAAARRTQVKGRGVLHGFP